MLNSRSAGPGLGPKLLSEEVAGGPAGLKGFALGAGAIQGSDMGGAESFAEGMGRSKLRRLRRHHGVLSDRQPQVQKILGRRQPASSNAVSSARARLTSPRSG